MTAPIVLDESPYGFCPRCGCKGKTRERRPHGNDSCFSGHVYRSTEALAARPTDLATLRSGARSSDATTARIALRALGRLERPALIPDILPGLRYSLPEVRAEAANAVAQAAQGLKTPGMAPVPLAPVQAALITRLGVEADASFRAALC